MKLLEKDFRKWVSWVFTSPKGSPRIDWTEWAQGGTPGQPDCRIFIAKWYPVELKVWERTTKGIRFDVRPDQRRYHILGGESGKNSLFLVAVSNEDETFNVYTFLGSKVTADLYPDQCEVPLWLVAENQVIIPKSEKNRRHALEVYDRMVAIVSNDSFWWGWSEGRSGWAAQIPNGVNRHRKKQHSWDSP